MIGGERVLDAVALGVPTSPRAVVARPEFRRTVDSGDVCNGLAMGLLRIAHVMLRAGLIQMSEDATQER